MTSAHEIECPNCLGRGYLAAYSAEMRPTFLGNYACNECCGTGRALLDLRDDLQRDHEDGDADGMGGCRAVLVAFALTGAVGVTAWALTTWLGPLIFG